MFESVRLLRPFRQRSTDRGQIGRGTHEQACDRASRPRRRIVCDAEEWLFGLWSRAAEAYASAFIFATKASLLQRFQRPDSMVWKVTRKCSLILRNPGTIRNPGTQSPISKVS